jgi:hypothetical protein
VISQKVAETSFWIFFTKRQVKIVKTISAHQKSIVLIFRTLFKNIHLVTLSLNLNPSGVTDSWQTFPVILGKKVWLLLISTFEGFRH